MPCARRSMCPLTLAIVLFLPRADSPLNLANLLPPRGEGEIIASRNESLGAWGSKIAGRAGRSARFMIKPACAFCRFPPLRLRGGMVFSVGLPIRFGWSDRSVEARRGNCPRSVGPECLSVYKPNRVSGEGLRLINLDIRRLMRI
jgi:hypothetical protein